MTRQAVRLFCFALLAATLACASPARNRKAKPAPLTPAQHVRMAESLLGAGRVNEALAEVDQAIAEQPDDARLHYQRGRVAFQGGRWDVAAESFRAALGLDPYLTDAHNFLGATYDQLGRKSDAEAEYRLALADPAYPTPEKVYYNLGLLFASQGRDAEAIDNLRKAVEIDPKYLEAHFRLASLLDRGGKLDEAASEYQVAAPAFRDSGEFHYQLGLVYFRLGQTERARESLRRAIEVAPGSRSAASAGELLKLLD